MFVGGGGGGAGWMERRLTLKDISTINLHEIL